MVLKKLCSGLLISFSVILFISCSSEDDSSNETSVSVADFLITIAENPQVGQLLGTISGSTNQGDVIFQITQQTPLGALEINSETGELLVADSEAFNFEARNEVSGIVKVSNGIVSKNADIQITLTDVTENNIFQGDVQLTTQEEVDLFGEGSYTAISGRLVIGNPDSFNSSISDLTPLSSLTTVGSDLVVIKNEGLESISPLSNITSSLRDLMISSNPNLTSLVGLHNIETSIGTLIIGGNSNLKNLTGLEGLISAQTFLISANSSLTSLDGIDNLVQISNRLDISVNAILNDLTALENITEVYDLNIFSNSQLTSLNGLSNVALINNLSIQGNDSLQNFNGLDGLIEIPISFRVIGNNGLSNFQGLESLERVGSIFEVVDNPSVEDFIGLNSLQEIEGEFWLNDTGATSLIGLESLLYVQNIKITNNNYLLRLEGLNNLLEAPSIDVNGNSTLIDYCSLQDLLTNTNQFFNSFGNAFNPSKQDIIDGNCSQ